MFRDIAGHDTAITDCPLPLGVVTLEDGDEIQIGVHRMLHRGCPNQQPVKQPRASARPRRTTTTASLNPGWANR
jgi:hypothetical protein